MYRRILISSNSLSSGFGKDFNSPMPLVDTWASSFASNSWVCLAVYKDKFFYNNVQDVKCKMLCRYAFLSLGSFELVGDMGFAYLVI